MEILEAQFRQILKLFCLEMKAQKISEFMGINLVTINRILGKIKERIVAVCKLESPFEDGKITLSLF